MTSVLARQALLAARISYRKNIRSEIRAISTTQTAKMKLIQFSYLSNPDELRVGYVADCGCKTTYVDLNKLDENLPTSVIEILKQGYLYKAIKLSEGKHEKIDPSEVKLHAPVTGMDKVLCVGLNYLDHCQEQNKTPPEVPMIFSKFASTVIGPQDKVKLRTDVTKCVDYEVELAVVMGRTASRVTAAEAYGHVAGYTVAQDISARDWQKERNAGQFLLGKSMDTFCPIGPHIVTTDELKEPQKCAIECSVNGIVRQNSNTCQLVHKIEDCIERLSSVMTLYPGDIILTGTPGGVGMYRDPPLYLKPGDIIESKIQGIGTLKTLVEEF